MRAQRRLCSECASAQADRVFIVRIQNICVLGYPKCANWRFWSDAQTDLSRSAHMFIGTFSHYVLSIGHKEADIDIHTANTCKYHNKSTCLYHLVSSCQKFSYLWLFLIDIWYNNSWKCHIQTAKIRLTRIRTLSQGRRCLLDIKGPGCADTQTGLVCHSSDVAHCCYVPDFTAFTST